MQEWIDDNRIEVEEVRKGADIDFLKRVEAIEKKYNIDIELEEDYMTDDLEFVGVYGEGIKGMSDTELGDFELKINEELSNIGIHKPKYSDYKEPGGENYREVLLTLPNKDPFAKLFTIEADSDGNYLLLNKEGKGYRGNKY